VQSGELLGCVLSDIIINIYYDMKTWENLEVGDKVRNLLGTRTILAKVQDRYVVTDFNDNNMCGLLYTKKKFLECGYEIIQPEQPKTWFINSKGEVLETGNPECYKHQKRIAWGNAFETKEEALLVREKIKNLLKSI